jgi:hypothetical protein
MFLICSYLPELYPNAARLLAAIPSSALLWWRLLHKTEEVSFDYDTGWSAGNATWAEIIDFGTDLASVLVEPPS